MLSKAPAMKTLSIAGATAACLILGPLSLAGAQPYRAWCAKPLHSYRMQSCRVKGTPDRAGCLLQHKDPKIFSDSTTLKTVHLRPRVAQQHEMQAIPRQFPTGPINMGKSPTRAARAAALERCLKDATRQRTLYREARGCGTCEEPFCRPVPHKPLQRSLSSRARKFEIAAFVIFS
jgi:hypothetical protein